MHHLADDGVSALLWITLHPITLLLLTSPKMPEKEGLQLKMVACLHCTEEEDSGSQRLLLCIARKGRNESNSSCLPILQNLADHRPSAHKCKMLNRNTRHFLISRSEVKKAKEEASHLAKRGWHLIFQHHASHYLGIFFEWHLSVLHHAFNSRKGIVWHICLLRRASCGRKRIGWHLSLLHRASCRKRRAGDLPWWRSCSAQPCRSQHLWEMQSS